MEELKFRESDLKLDYQREKQEITADIDRLEMEHLQDVRNIRDKIIEAEVESRRIKADVEKTEAAIKKDEDNHRSAMDE